MPNPRQQEHRLSMDGLVTYRYSVVLVKVQSHGNGADIGYCKDDDDDNDDIDDDDDNSDSYSNDDDSLQVFMMLR